MKEKLFEIWNQHYKVIICVFIGLGIIISVAITASIIIQSQKPHDVPSVKREEALENAEITEEQKENMTESEKDYYVANEDVYQMSKEKLYSKETLATEFKDTENAMAKIISMYSDYDFEGVVEYIDKDILSKYNLSEGENTEIAGIYRDACNMLNYDRMENYTKEQILEEHHSPLTLAIDTIYAYHQRRNVVLIDMASVSPFFTKGSAKINDYRVVDKDSETFKKYENIAYEYDIRTMWEIDMSFPRGDGTCYAIENGIGQFAIVGYYGDEIAKEYITQSQWNAMDRDDDHPRRNK